MLPSALPPLSLSVYLGGLVESVHSDSDLASPHGLFRTHQLSDASLNNQVITSSCFLSHFAIVFGLSEGDVVYLRMASEGGGGGDVGGGRGGRRGGQGVFVETVMRYAGVVESLWSGLMGASPGVIQPRVLVISGTV